MNVWPGIRFGILMLVLAPTPAMANQPPGPLLSLSEVLILPLMLALSALGGAYKILDALRGGEPRKLISITGVGARTSIRIRFLRPTLAVFVVLFSMANEGLALLASLAFGIIALKRGGQMLLWGYLASARHERPPHLGKADPRRLIASGAVLLVGTVFLMGMALAFVNYWPWIGLQRREETLRSLVAYQLAYAQQRKSQIGRTEFHHILPTDREYDLFLRPLGGSYWTHRVEYGEKAETFRVNLLPTRFPIFPYNYLVSLPSFRADQTGQIRMIGVHWPYMVCPPDAPVVMLISQQDGERYLKDREKVP